MEEGWPSVCLGATQTQKLRPKICTPTIIPKITKLISID